ncbi:uncharacterized protein LOC120354476 isoform X2 [Nilaparvata lugens]|uniref:uncharacterized protein LOC120354476 isoform X2 n=1 Tax=Nilaparvata lugens TaxID=108931 RepID=UPI00193E4EFD|nr:uncharacterized protein LOC120354476 isoform X2 [Nilaparvata lugens]
MVSTLQMAMALPNCVTGNTENEELGMPTEDACGGMWREFGALSVTEVGDQQGKSDSVDSNSETFNRCLPGPFPKIV